MTLISLQSAITNGGSAMFAGRVYTKVSDLPTQATIDSYNTSIAAANATLAAAQSAADAAVAALNAAGQTYAATVRQLNSQASGGITD